MHILSPAVSLNVDDMAASGNFFTAHPDSHESVAATGFMALTRPGSTDMVARQPPGSTTAQHPGSTSMSPQRSF
ncbi:hypothetical protein ACWEU6_24575 [Streptosporangium sandarakinum]